MNKVNLSAMALVIASIVMGCVPSATPSPTPSATPSQTPSATPSATPSETGEFSIYLLADEVPASELSMVDLEDLELQDEPILSGDDIIAYSKETHEIELTAEACEQIQQLFTLPAHIQGIPFVAAVGTDRIYAGVFLTRASSISFDGVVISEPFDADRHVIRIVLGYPSPEAFTGKDPRSNPEVLESLEAAGRLK